MRESTKILCAASLALAAAALAPPGARTQDAPASVATQQLWLARSCVHELTWAFEHDCEPMYQAFMGLLDQIGHTTESGRRRTVVDAIRIYQRRFWGGTSTRPWARQLRLGLRADPEGWPEAWPAYRLHASDFARVHGHAGAIVRGEVETVCKERPRHWGSRNPRLPDLARARRRIASGAWREVDCGPTVQAYYALVRR